MRKPSGTVTQKASRPVSGWQIRHQEKVYCVDYQKRDSDLRIWRSSNMDKSAAVRLLPGTLVTFRGGSYQVLSVKTGSQLEAPFFRLRSLEHGYVTGLVSYAFIETTSEKIANC
jgi:hypothetical protein